MAEQIQKQNKNRINLLLATAAIAAIIAAVIFSGYFSELKPTSKAQPKEITIVDGNGEEVTIRKPVERIIVEYTDNAELISILNKKDKVVGVDFIIEKTEIQFPELSKKTSLGNMNQPDYEAILKLNPDLLLTFSPNIKEKKEKLPGVAVVFLGLYYPDLINPIESKFVRGVRNLGKILDAEKEAEEYIKWYLSLVDKISNKTKVLSENKKPKVFITNYPYVHLEATTFNSYTKRDTLSQMVIIGGGKNIVSDLPEFSQEGYKIQVNAEWLIAQNPDIIILHAVRHTFGGKTLEPPHGYDADNFAGLREGLEKFMKRPDLANVNAVKNKKVYVFTGTFRNDASGGIIGAAYMAKIFHPELFKDMNPEAIHQEYLTRFQKLNYDLNKHGIFVYPPIEANGTLMGVPEQVIEKKPKKSQITIIDGNGEEITVHKPVERIIVEYTDNAELIRILNKKDKVVGVAGYDYIFEKCKLQFPELWKMPSVGHPWAMDYEAALALNPDLLLTFSSDIKEKKKNLPGVDVVFLGLYYPDLTNPKKSKFIRGVRNLGKILDAENEAEGYIKWYLGVINNITSKTKGLSDDKKPKVFISSYPHTQSADTKYRTFTKRDTLAQAGIIAGGKNIAEGLHGFTQGGISVEVSPEWLIAQNPDIIILHAVDRVDLYGYEIDDITGIKKGLNEYMKHPELANINAVKNKKVYVFYGAFRNDASGGVIGAAYMAKIFHPELFKDLNPEAIHQEYLTRFQKLNYDLNKHGIFVYPPIDANGALMGIPDRYKGRPFIDASKK